MYNKGFKLGRMIRGLLTPDLGGFLKGFFDGLKKEVIEDIIKQNDTRLNESIRKFGCRFRSLQAIAEFSVGKFLTVEQIETAYKELQKPKVMNANCECGEKEHEIINHAFKMLGSTWKGKQVGAKDLANNDEWAEQSGDFVIFDYRTPQGKHFTLANSKAKEIFDPWNYKLGKLEKTRHAKNLFYRVTK